MFRICDEEVAEDVMEVDANANETLSATLGVGPITLHATREESNQQILVRNVETRVLCIHVPCVNVLPLMLRSHKNAASGLQINW